MTRSRVSVLAAVTLVTAACTDDWSGASPLSPAAVDGSPTTDKCTPISGYSLPVNDHGGEAIDGSTYPITASDSFFQPTCVLRATPGTVTLRVSNIGGLLHNVTVTEQGIDVDVARGETIEVNVEVNDTPLVFVCKYHRTTGMVGAVLPDNE